MMRKAILFLITVSLVSMAWVQAVPPCHKGKEVTIGYQTYCAANSPAAYQLASIQNSLYNLVYSEPVYYKTIFSGWVNGQYCISVRFVRCVKKTLEDPHEGSDLGEDPFVSGGPTTGKKGNTSFGQPKVSEMIGHTLISLERQGWEIGVLRLLENGTFEVDVIDERGDIYNLPFDFEGLIEP